MSSEKCLKLQKQFISKGRLQNYTNYIEYARNIKLSKDFYIPLSIVEVSFRNSLNHFFMNKIGSDWLSRNDILKLDAQRNINNATKMIVQQHKLITNDNLIAELNFGFWIRLLTKAYSSYLRYSDLKQIFPNLPSSKEKKINRHFVFYKTKQHTTF